MLMTVRPVSVVRAREQASRSGHQVRVEADQDDGAGKAQSCREEEARL